MRAENAEVYICPQTGENETRRLFLQIHVLDFVDRMS